jgi:nicotinamide mononucleotide adenylyltransferase
MKYSMFVGRWQGVHDGHKWLFDQQLKKGKNILICIRDCPLDDPDEENKYIPEEIMGHLSEEYREEILEGRVKLMIIPDIESINYGREVGYEIIEHKPPEHIKNIHGRELRKNEEVGFR